ncbi:FAD-binding oxidoreductase [Catenulispora rubra]|uniref:FAD-binding oxidoreductase n=1 Tax=Catenulispora rubra TaxID=280293 RepID=UPI002B272681|nr:FAD-linked oxidase C-terminal domain-containing protein [Catenulispora rubra]
MTGVATGAASGVVDLLAAVLPAERIRIDRPTLAAHRHDRSGWAPDGLPSAVVFPESTEEVAAILRAADAARTPVVTRGAGTGLSGAATATDGEIVLSTARLDRVLELSPDDELAVVEPGVISADLDRAAAEHGLCYAPDPGSVEICTIGGTIATNAGGLRCAKYGVTRESVLGLDVVLADGRRIQTGRRTVKGVTGYDLTSLFIGSEGTLGVVVGATLRLLPRPASTSTIAAFFDDVEGAAQAVARIRAQRIRPAVAELLDGATLAAIDAAEATEATEATGFAARGGALLIVQTDGAGAAAEADAALSAIRPGSTDVAVTDDPAEAAELLRARRLALPALEKLGRVLIEDIAVPRSRLAEAVRAVSAIADRHGVRVATLAHAADGNLHPIFVLDDAPANAPVPEPAWTAAAEVFRTALRLGGTLTGEHGVGLLKRHWVAEEVGDVSLAVHYQIKQALDPHGILNPGKALGMP